MNLYETAMGQRFFNVQLPALINTLKDIAATLSRPAPSAISFPADPRYLISYILILLRFFLDLQGFSGFGVSATTPFLRHFRIEFYVRKPF